MKNIRMTQTLPNEGSMGTAFPSQRLPEVVDDRPVDDKDWRDSVSLVTSSLSMVLVAATALFVSVGFNPKRDEYGSLPWAYAVVCLVGSALSRLVSLRTARTQPQTSQELEGKQGAD